VEAPHPPAGAPNTLSGVRRVLSPLLSPSRAPNVTQSITLAIRQLITTLALSRPLLLLLFSWVFYSGRALFSLPLLFQVVVSYQVEATGAARIRSHPRSSSLASSLGPNKPPTCESNVVTHAATSAIQGRAYTGTSQLSGNGACLACVLALVGHPCPGPVRLLGLACHQETFS
jgi:hypothetical protein